MKKLLLLASFFIVVTIRIDSLAETAPQLDDNVIRVLFVGDRVPTQLLPAERMAAFLEDTWGGTLFGAASFVGDKGLVATGRQPRPRDRCTRIEGRYRSCAHTE